MHSKIINIGDIPVKMACSADTLRQYRIKFGRDLLVDLQKISKENINLESLECLAYVMACQGDPELKLTIDEWLDQFGPVDVINASKEILELWGVNMMSTSKSKKK